MNNGYNFTERVRKCLSLAREESAALHHEYVGTEHLLLGMLTEGEGVGCAVLHALDADLNQIRADVLKNVKAGKTAAAAGPDLPYSSRAKKVLELAMAEARDLSHSYVGSEHLLLGLLREERGVAAQVMTHNGLTWGRVREETLRLLGGPDVIPPPSRFSEPSFGKTRSFKRVTGVFVDIHYEDGTAERKEFANAGWAIRYLESM